MRAIILICLGIVVLNPAVAAELYRWVDDQGRIHYSDRPAEGAEVVKLDTGPSTPPPAAPARAPAASTRPAPPRPEPGADTFVAYTSVGVLSPQQDQVLWNIGGQLTVRVGVQPQLQETHRIVVRYDGRPVEDWPFGATSHQLSDVYRGTHTVSATVTDAGGNVLLSSQPVTFHVKQTSVLN